MPADLAKLASSYRFEARLKYSTLSEQKNYLVQGALERFNDRSGAEVTSNAFAGSSSTFQFRDATATPQEHQEALQIAIEELESEIAGEVAKSLCRPFGIRFGSGYAPAEVLDRI
jgi:hypothetical protein